MAIGKNKDNPLKVCPSCNGKGIKKCPECKGKGRPFDCGHCTNLENNTWGTKNIDTHRLRTKQIKNINRTIM
jgi:RecJ-like exonuclease